MKEISGGVCAAYGFRANGVHCGIRNGQTKRDLAIITSDVLCSAACVYTSNLVKSAPIKVTKKNVSNGYAQAVICNSGNANTCNENGVEIAEGMCELTAEFTGINADDVIVASTGVIGQPLSLDPIKSHMQELVEGLGDKSIYAEEAIMTTDTREKEVAVEFSAGEKVCRIGGIAKGSGMIHPNMATMLVFITTDCAISSEMLQKALSEDVKSSFNMVSIDGDTSTNDMVSILANGLSGNAEIIETGADFNSFCSALKYVTRNLCRKIARDGEGASKLLICDVKGAVDEENARIIAKSVICSSLVKAAMFGADANWGRILCAIGYSGAKTDVKKISVGFTSRAGHINVCENGLGIEFSEEKAKEILLEDEIYIEIGLKDGDGCAETWGCDLTYDYVKINGDYRT